MWALSFPQADAQACKRTPTGVHTHTKCILICTYCRIQRIHEERYRVLSPRNTFRILGGKNCFYDNLLNINLCHCIESICSLIMLTVGISLNLSKLVFGT